MSVILTSALTDATLTGTGVFDVLMRANKAHLEAEFAKNRIKGPEYATVYLGALTQVLQVAMTFTLTKDKAALEADLLAQQILNTTAQRALIVQQTANALVENDNLIKQGCVLASQFDLNMGQVARVAAETLLLTQKKITEAAQTTAQSVDDSSVVGRQKALYQAQTAGFARNAEQAATKLMVDTWSIRRTTDTGTIANGTNSLDDAAIGRAVSKMLTGVGA
jgi:hypothetical protein